MSHSWHGVHLSVRWAPSCCVICRAWAGVQGFGTLEADDGRSASGWLGIVALGVALLVSVLSDSSES